jgi:hypothetical protein
MPKNRNTGSPHTGAVAKRVTNEAMPAFRVMGEVAPCLSEGRGRGQLVTLFVPDKLVPEEADRRKLNVFAATLGFMVDSTFNPDSCIRPAQWTGRASAGKCRFHVKADTLGEMLQMLAIRGAGSVSLSRNGGGQ